MNKYIPIKYDTIIFNEGLRLDVLIEDLQLFSHRDTKDTEMELNDTLFKIVFVRSVALWLVLYTWIVMKILLFVN